VGDPGRGFVQHLGGRRTDGLHPQTLRVYEREGLLDPVRSTGGTRRYSTDDLDRLHQIMALTADGLTLAGVRRVLELQEQTRRLQAEIDRLKAAARSRPAREAAHHTPGPGGMSGPAR
jgi:DNA-binding transcriptional MerR regulator